MKKFITIVILFIATTIAHAQSFTKLNNLKGTAETIVTQEMFKLIADIDLDSSDKAAKEMKVIIDNLKEVRIYSTSNSDSAAKINAFANTYITGQNLVKLMSVKEDDQMFTFHIKKGSNDKKVKDLVMLMEESGKKTETTFLIISGDIDLNQISKITKYMKTPGQQQIEKATKG